MKSVLPLITPFVSWMVTLAVSLPEETSESVIVLSPLRSIGTSWPSLPPFLNEIRYPRSELAVFTFSSVGAPFTSKLSPA